jgi:hypothetical protein
LVALRRHHPIPFNLNAAPLKLVPVPKETVLGVLQGAR